ncbi:MAG: Lrp/AsnC family transcriptional regulator [Nanoarchaeota archaeon]|nr:Lrp/AsnC family transcriptional regulator [Nanoarchaeota archaeon]
MDKIDEKLLRGLDSDPKVPLTALAKKSRISKQAAVYRLKRILKKQRVTKFGTIINLKSLGMEHYRIFLTFNSKKEHTQKEIFKYLRNRKGIYWAARTGGKYDLIIALFVQDFEAFDKFIENFNQKFPGLVKDYKSCYVVHYYVYKHKYLNKDYSCISYGYNDKIKQIDGLDKYILKKIKDNCRLSSLEISKGKDVSYKTIKNRIKSLEKKKIILGYRLFIKSSKYKPFIVLFSFKDYSRETEKKLVAYLSKDKNVTQTLRLFGLWNLFIQIRIEDYEKLQNLIIRLRDKFCIIGGYEIIPVFEDISINLLPIGASVK